MSIRFCPDCGAECGPDDFSCRDCSFPLQFHLVTSQGDLHIPKSQQNKWHRIAQILRRNGIKVETRSARFPARFFLWWSLPIAGGLFFLGTLLFGGKLVDTIWPPLEAPTTVLDLSQVNADSTQDNGEAADGDSGAGDAVSSDVDTSFLKDALGTTDEQKVITQDLNMDVTEFLDRPKLSRREIETLAAESLLSVNVGDDAYRGTLLNGKGLLIVDQQALNNAFQREKKTIKSSGGLNQEVVFVVPKVGLINPGNAEAEKILDSELLGIGVLQAPVNVNPSHEIDFDRDLAVGDTVYIATYRRRAMVLEKRTIGNPIQSPTNIPFWSITEPMSGETSGVPVFNEQGLLAGVLLLVNGEDLVLSMLRLRERAPQVYRELID